MLTPAENTAAIIALFQERALDFTHKQALNGKTLEQRAWLFELDARAAYGAAALEGMEAAQGEEDDEGRIDAFHNYAEWCEAQAAELHRKAAIMREEVGYTEAGAFDDEPEAIPQYQQPPHFGHLRIA